MKSFLEYRTALAGMTVREAMDILQHVDSQDESVIIQTERGNKTVRINDHCKPLPGYMLATEVYPLIFAGGPPDHYFWVPGNLFDMVIDKLMYRDAVEEKRMLIGTRRAANKSMQQIPTIRNLGC